MDRRSAPAQGVVRGIDHVGIVVRDADASARYYVDVLGLAITGDEIADDPGARLLYLGAGDGSDHALQLVQPVRPGPVANWLDAHGEGLHHVCLEVDDIAEALDRIVGQSQRPIFRGGRGRRACFLAQTPEGVAIELTETRPTR